jgi:hypothetical protein
MEAAHDAPQGSAVGAAKQGKSHRAQTVEADENPIALDQPGTNRARADVIKRLAGDLATLAQAGDMDGARAIHEAMASTTA